MYSIETLTFFSSQLKYFLYLDLQSVSEYVYIWAIFCHYCCLRELSLNSRVPRLPWLSLSPPPSHTELLLCTQVVYLFILMLNQRWSSVFLFRQHSFKSMVLLSQKNQRLQMLIDKCHHFDWLLGSGSLTLSRILNFIFLLESSLQWWD